MSNEEEYKLSLLENAIDYLNEAMDYYDNAQKLNNNRVYKFCVLHCVSFAELFLKYYISLENKSLIFQNSKKNDKTISLDKAIEILKGSKFQKIESIEEEIKILKNLRNQAMHYQVLYDVEKVERDIGQLLQIFIEFDENNKKIGIIEKVETKYREKLNYIREGYLNYLEQATGEMEKEVESAEKSIGHRSSDETTIFPLAESELECIECENETLYRIEDTYYCSFCREEFDYIQDCERCSDKMDTYAENNIGESLCDNCQYEYEKIMAE